MITSARRPLVDAKRPSICRLPIMHFSKCRRRDAEDGRRLTLAITEAGLAALEGEPASEATEPSPSSTKPSKKKRTSKTNAKASPPVAREGTKQALLIDLLKRKTGATIDEIVEATGWQAHSVRGAISGTLRKKLGMTVTSSQVDGRGRVYRIATRS